MKGGTAGFLIACCLILGVSSLTLFTAPSLGLWKLSIVATEFGHWLVPVALALALLGARGPRPRRVGAALACIAAVLFLRPDFEARRIAASLPESMRRAFGPLSQAEEDSLPPPFSFAALWLGPHPPAVAAQHLEFARHGDAPLFLDFYRPPGAGATPCVVVLHSGGWNGGTLSEFEELDWLLAKHGYSAAVVEYRLAPRWAWPAQREDVLDALRYLKTHAADLGIDPRRFVLLGRSAGGQIAEAVAYGAGDAAIRGCIAFYAPADLAFAFRYAYPEDLLNSYQLLVDYVGGTLAQAPQRYAAASGISLVGKGGVPTLLLHGKRDPLVWNLQSARLANRLRELNIPNYFLDLGWATHGFDYNAEGPGGQLSAYAALYFIAAVTAEPKAR
jgi:acetyl esterase/lipase